MDYQGVLICGELVEGRLASIANELLGAGRRLADDLGQGLGLLLMGSRLGSAAQEAIAFGADRVYMADDPLLADYHPDSYTAVATRVCRELKPAIFLLGQTDLGREVAPRVAARLGVGLSMDCIELKIDPDSRRLLQTRPVYGGNALALVASDCFPQLATVRQRSMAPLEPDPSRQGQVIPLAAGIDTSVFKARLVDRVKEKLEGVKLEEAKVVVAGGQGMGSAENFKLVWELAGLLGGAVGATRSATEEGWVPSSLMIGQTGKVVSPKLYIAVALSGAAQHLAGCARSKHIVAINLDAEANIFKVADFGVIGDFKEALPALIEKCRELLAT